jgi:catechol 2,3-dioxygenase-like lactoylglutathione lyase family enzyme
MDRLRVTLVTLGVADVARARRFYEAMGLTASSAGTAEIVFLDAGGCVLALFGRDALAEDAGLAEGAGPPGAMALACNVPIEGEVQALIDRAVAAGARQTKPATKADWGGTSGYFADPDGHLWEVAWNPHFPLDERGLVKLPA